MIPLWLSMIIYYLRGWAIDLLVAAVQERQFHSLALARINCKRMYYVDQKTWREESTWNTWV
jgi:hypothetical protein